MTHTVRAYRALLKLLLPAGFSDAFADELLGVFIDLDADTRAHRGRLAAWFALAAELPGLFRIAVRERQTSRTVRAHHATTHLAENMFDSLWQDLTFAVRSLRRSPGFTAVLVLTLALGIGANTAIFSVVHAVLLSPLKLHDAERLMAVGEQPRSATTLTIDATSPGSFFDWKSSAKTMDLGAYATVNRVLTGMGEPQQLAGTSVSGGTMQVLGVAPLFGRLLVEGDEDPSAPPVLVLTYDAWRRFFGDDRSVLGKTMTINNLPRTIVGVMPPGFTFPGAPNDVWVPAQLDAAFRANRDQYFLSVVGRLKPGATLAQARAEMNGIMTRLVRDYPKYNEGSDLAVAPLRDTIVGDVRSRLFVLMGGVLFVLLITCANIGNLLLARAGARRREIAVRQALGAGVSRIARQLLTESILLALIGGALGMVLGKSFLKLLMAAPAFLGLPRAEEITLEAPVLLFALATSLIAGVLFGIAPAWQLARGKAAGALRDGSRGSSGQHWMRSTLVVSELALAMILLTGAGLLTRSFLLMQQVDPGVTTNHVLTFNVSRRRTTPEFFPATLDRIRALPGVKSAAITTGLPLTGRGIGAWFNRIDRPLPENVKPTGEAYRIITPDYFATAGIPLRVGRTFDSRDNTSTPSIIINEALAKKYYPSENPIGKLVYLGAPENRLFQSASIVGVVGNSRDTGLGVDALPIVYIPHAVLPTYPFVSYVVRTTGDPLAVAGDARRIIHEMDPNIPIQDVRTLDDILNSVVAPARWSTLLLGIFAGVALLIAVLGVFGVLSYVVAQRTRELGIRIALGASAGDVQRLVVFRGLGSSPEAWHSEFSAHFYSLDSCRRCCTLSRRRMPPHFAASRRFSLLLP